ncbi:uncharacterized protein LOC122813988 isoform X2 [Protopterus annectens]|uniref:uncharacterized protein LOC122813988 isoform X2 n=1 Tax=Protopterus annectens TaxID=7888 RepID=UPI001CF9E20D|nr:uncharacterized protein LOC122813988 isoform X2 [Protopterus annectens]
MDPFTMGGAMWAFVLILPVVIITTLCIGCWKHTANRIPQTVEDGDYQKSDNTFAVIRPTAYHPTTIPTTINSAPPRTLGMLTVVQRSPLPSDSRRSSYNKPESDNDSTSNYVNTGSIPSYENSTCDPSDNEAENQDPNDGYITVLPDEVAPVQYPVDIPVQDKHSGHLSPSVQKNCHAPVSPSPKGSRGVTARCVVGVSANKQKSNKSHCVQRESGCSEDYENLAQDKVDGGCSSRESEDECPDYVNTETLPEHIHLSYTVYDDANSEDDYVNANVGN